MSSELPHDINKLKNIILRQSEEIQGLTDLVALLRREQFGKSLEQISVEQMGMFDETEAEALNPEPEDEESIKVPEHERKRGKQVTTLR
jgi:hypothetical protein